jgi:hypothetical protein
VSLTSEPTIKGSPGTKTCPDCQGEIAKVLTEPASWLHVWDWPAHSCPERGAREAAEQAEYEARRAEWLKNPPDERVQSVRERCRLPHWTPAGLFRLKAMPDYDPRKCPGVKELRRHREMWLAASRPERGLWLWGETGLRKTAAMCGLLFDLNHQTDQSAVYWKFLNLLNHARKKAGREENDYNPGQIASAGCFLLDDLGTFRPTKFAIDLLFDLVDTAYDGGPLGARQTLYVTSNEPPDEVMELLNDVPEHPGMGKRIVRRLVQITDVVEVKQ